MIHFINSVHIRQKLEPYERTRKNKEKFAENLPVRSQFFVDTDLKECSIMVSVDDFVGEPQEKLLSNNVYLSVIDYNDIYHYKYVFAYQVTRS